MQKRLDLGQIEASSDTLVASVKQMTTALPKLDPDKLDDHVVVNGSDGVVAMLPFIAATIDQHVHAIERGVTESDEPIPEEWVGRLVAADLRIVDALQEMADTLGGMDLYGPLLHLRGKIDAMLIEAAAAIETLKKAVPSGVN